MKEWVKQQLSQLSTWAGLLMIVGSYIFPHTLFIIIGVLFVATDDDKAKRFFSEVGSEISKEID
jgi:hypothetical protein